MQVCPLCAKKLSKPIEGRAVISPWLRNWGGIKKRTSKLIICDFCEGAFFDYRFKDDEMARIYSDYRSEEYTLLRTKWEPWYTFFFNAAHNFGSVVDQRKRILESFLNKSGAKNLNVVVDVGGDLGQYIPSLNIDTRKYVIDMSSRDLVPGVLRVASLDELSNVDLIIYANVLEHVANPLEELSKLILKAKYVYVEVPYGIPVISPLRQSRLFQMLVIILSLSSHFWKRFSAPSTGRDPRSSILRQSEHLSFFNEKTLKVMATSLQVEVLIEIATIPTPEGAAGKALQALFCRTL